MAKFQHWDSQLSFAGPASMWPYIFLAECHCLDSVMLLKIVFSSLLSSYWNNNNSFSYTFLWVYTISAIKCTCSHCVIQPVLRRLEKVFQFSLKWNFEWLLSNNKTHFLENLGLFSIYLQALEVFWSNEPGIPLSVREKLKTVSLFCSLPQRAKKYAKNLWCIKLQAR